MKYYIQIFNVRMIIYQNLKCFIQIELEVTNSWNLLQSFTHVEFGSDFFTIYMTDWFIIDIMT